MILSLPTAQRRRFTLPRLCAAAAIPFAMLPISAIAHVTFIVWCYTTDHFPIAQFRKLISSNLPLASSIETGIEAYGIFIATTATSFLLSWIGYLCLLPLFLLQRKCNFDGWLPTALIGAFLGAAAVIPIALGPLDFRLAARHLLRDLHLQHFALQGLLHALSFWACLYTLSPKTPPQP